MNYLGIIIIAFLAVQEYRCCGPAGTPKSMCDKWNKVLESAALAKNVLTDSKHVNTQAERIFDKVGRILTGVFNKKDLAGYKHYITYGVDKMQLHAYETIEKSLSQTKQSGRYVFYLFAEASVRVSKYFHRMHNHEKSLQIIHYALHQFDNIPEDQLEPYKTHMWIAYLREHQLKLVQEIEKYKGSANYVENKRKESFDKALEKYGNIQASESKDPDMTFLIGKEKLKTLNAHLPLPNKFKNVAINSTIEEGIQYLENYTGMLHAGDLIECKFILGNAYMVLDEIEKARDSYVRALLTPVKNAEDRAYNYEVQRTLERFYNKLVISKDAPHSNHEIQTVFDNIDATISRKYHNFWKELLEKDAFGTKIIYAFIKNALNHNVKTSTESDNYEPNEDILNKAKSALRKLEHQIPGPEFNKWMTVLLGAENYFITKSRAFLYLRMHLDYALKTKDKTVDDILLTYLHGKYLCKITSNSASYDGFINVAGWNIPTLDNDVAANANSCLEIMGKEDDKSAFINEIDRDTLLALMYWRKKKHNDATKVLEKAIFSRAVLTAEDRWYNFLAQDLLGNYQAENIKQNRNKDPIISPAGFISLPTSNSNDGTNDYDTPIVESTTP